MNIRQNMSYKGQENSGQKGQIPQGHEQTVFLLQKSEKLATAIYMITDIIHEREPLRWKIREDAMSVLSQVSELAHTQIPLRWNVLYRIIQTIEGIENLLELSKASRLVSEMNASIVLAEYRGMKEKLRSSWNLLEDTETPVLNRGFFKIDEPKKLPERFPQAVSPNTQLDKEQIQRTVYGEERQVDFPVRLERKKIQTDINSKEQKDKRLDRRTIITNLLKNHHEVSVSDVLRAIPGVSDKTIQRELVGMVEEGILLKKGEKRWSTYLLNNGGDSEEIKTHEIGK